jgi:DNA polymerase III subunit delta
LRVKKKLKTDFVKMKYQELMIQLKQKTIAPFYLFSGEETYLKEDALQKITGALLTAENREFNYDLIYADEHGAAESVINRVSSLPFAVAQRMVVVKRAEKFKQADQAKLLGFLNHPVLTACLIFVTTDRVNLKTGFWSQLGKIGESVEFWPLFDSQIASWIREKAREKGKAIAAEAISYLARAVGNDLMELDNQISQLIIYCDVNKTITLEDVKKLTPDIKTGDVYEMINAIGEKEKKMSLSILDKLLQEGEEPLKLLSNISFRFRKFMEARHLLDEKCPASDINRQLGINTFLDRDFLKQANNFSKKEITAKFKDILKADIELVRAGKKDAQLIMELLVLKLCR